MACNTCNNCGNSSPCGCKDHGLSTPCGYTDCGPGNERCDDIQCAECVSYCGTTFRLETEGGTLEIQQGERLDSIIQKLSLIIVNGLGACTATDVHHAPYNVYAQDISGTTATVVWSGTSSLTAALDIYYRVDSLTPGPWIQANTLAISPLVNTFTITNLAPGIKYVAYIKSEDTLANPCDSVQIVFTTVLL